MHLPCVIAGMSNAEYHAHPAVSRSALDQISRSPFHYHAAYLSPDRPAREEKPSFKMGTLVHCQVLEPGEIDNRYLLMPEDLSTDKRNTETKRWLANVPPGITVITKEEYSAALAMEASLLRHAYFRSAMEKGTAELSVFCRHEETGIDVKVRPDWVHETGDGGVILVDLKTTTDASPREFARSVARYNYHQQAAFYSDVYAQATGKRVIGFAFAVVENSYPYASACYTLDSAAMHKGRAKYFQSLQLLKFCRDKESWPAWGEDLNILELPKWAINDD